MAEDAEACVLLEQMHKHDRAVLELYFTRQAEQENAELRALGQAVVDVGAHTPLLPCDAELGEVIDALRAWLKAH